VQGAGSRNIFSHDLGGGASAVSSSTTAPGSSGSGLGAFSSGQPHHQHSASQPFFPTSSAAGSQAGGSQGAWSIWGRDGLNTTHLPRSGSAAPQRPSPHPAAPSSAFSGNSSSQSTGMGTLSGSGRRTTSVSTPTAADRGSPAASAQPTSAGRLDVLQALRNGNNVASSLTSSLHNAAQEDAYGYGSSVKGPGTGDGAASSVDVEAGSHAPSSAPTRGATSAGPESPLAADSSTRLAPVEQAGQPPSSKAGQPSPSAPSPPRSAFQQAAAEAPHLPAAGASRSASGALPDPRILSSLGLEVAHSAVSVGSPIARTLANMASIPHPGSHLRQAFTLSLGELPGGFPLQSAGSAGGIEDIGEEDEEDPAAGLSMSPGRAPDMDTLLYRLALANASAGGAAPLSIPGLDALHLTARGGSHPRTPVHSSGLLTPGAGMTSPSFTAPHVVTTSPVPRGHSTTSEAGSASGNESTCPGVVPSKHLWLGNLNTKLSRAVLKVGRVLDSR
jgi:hypothetical protein